jgi:hypothetical protein
MQSAIVVLLWCIIMATFSYSIYGFVSAKHALSRSSSLRIPALWKASTKINPLPPLKPATAIMRFFSSKIEEKESKVSESSRDETDLEESGLKAKVSAMWKKYGVLAITTYFSIYVCTLGSIFFVLDFDIINASSVGFDPVETIKKVTNFSSTAVPIVHSANLVVVLGL